MGASKLTDVERPRLGDDVHKHTLQPLALGTDPQDGLPRPVVSLSMEDSVAPALSPETLICMGDDDVFVIRDDWGDVQHSVHAIQVRRTRKGAYQLIQPIEKLPFSGWEPLRPQCEHYKRVMTPFENDPKVRQVERVCTAQRGESGEFVSLSDQQVLACEHRVPRDFVSEARLRQFDAARIDEGRKTVEEWEPPK